MPRMQDKKYERAVELYMSGSSIGRVASFYGVSRQAMYTILKRRGVIFRPQKRTGSANHFYRGGQKMQKDAQREVQKAILNGTLTRQPCAVCGLSPVAIDGRNLVHAHHPNYEKPLEIIWLCVKCHHEEHKKLSSLHVDTNYNEQISGLPDLRLSEEVA